MTRIAPYRFRLLICLFLFIVVPFTIASAPVVKTTTPTRIVSEKMTYDAVKQLINFEGKVYATRLNMEIWSEKLTVYLDNSDKKPDKNSVMGMGAGKAERIVVEGGVRMKQDDKSATCGKATYYVSQGKIVMEQNPVVNDGPNQIRGKVINYFTQTGHSEVLGNVDVRITTDNDVSLTPGSILGGPR